VYIPNNSCLTRSHGEQTSSHFLRLAACWLKQRQGYLAKKKRKLCLNFLRNWAEKLASQFHGVPTLFVAIFLDLVFVRKEGSFALIPIRNDCAKDPLTRSKQQGPKPAKLLPSKRLIQQVWCFLTFGRFGQPSASA
jgi:hypothetical protein